MTRFGASSLTFDEDCLMLTGVEEGLDLGLGLLMRRFFAISLFNRGDPFLQVA